MPDLGPYFVPVLSAYVVAILLIVGLTVMSVLRAGRIKRKLKDIENRTTKNG